MNDDRQPSVLERLDRVAVPPAPVAEMVAAGRGLRRRQRRAAVAGAVAAVALAVGGGAALVQLVDPGEPGPVAAGSGLSEKEVATAEAVARAVIEEQGATVTSATVVARSGTTSDSNTGHPCTSGRELEILLIGAFPHTVTGGHVVKPGDPAPDFTVRAMGVTADAESGLPCLIGVRTGEVEPLPGSTMLDIGAAPVLPVRVSDQVPSFADVPIGGPEQGAVRAVWDADEHTLTYVSWSGYSSSCPPTGSATVSDDGVVLLTIIENPGRSGYVCTADAVRVAVTVNGVTSWPTGLTVTENGRTEDVSVATTGLDVFED